MSVIVASNTNPTVTYPGAPDTWEQWMNIDFSLFTLEKSEPIVLITGMMDTEEITVVTKRPRRIHRREKLVSSVSPARKRVHHPIKIKMDNIKTLAEYQSEKQKLLEQLNNAKNTEQLNNAKNNEQTKKQKKVKKVRKEEWSTVKKVEKPVSLIRRPEQVVPSRNGQGNGTTLVLKNLPKIKVNSKEIQKFFAKCGSVKFVNVLINDDGNCKGLAFVKFENKVGSDKGLTLNEFWYENNKVYVEYARN